MTSTFKVGTAGCDDCDGRVGWFPSGPGNGRGGCGDCGVCIRGVFPTIFVLFLNDLPSEALSWTLTTLSL